MQPVVEDRSVETNIRKSIITFLAIAYLGLCFYLESDETRFSQNECSKYARLFCLKLVIYILMPLAVSRQVIRTSCISSNSYTFNGAYQGLQFFEHFGLGLYLFKGMFELFKMTVYMDCPSEITIHRINYALILLWGIRITSIYLLFAIVLICCFPVLCFMLW